MEITYKTTIKIEKESIQPKEEPDERNKKSIEQCNKYLEKERNHTYFETSFDSCEMTQNHFQNTIDGNEAKLNEVEDKLRIKIEKSKTDDYYYKPMYEVEDNKQWIDQLNNPFEIKTNQSSIENTYNCSARNHSYLQKIIKGDAYNVTKGKIKVEISETGDYYQGAVIKIDKQNEDIKDQFTEVILEKTKVTNSEKVYNSCVKTQNNPQTYIVGNTYNIRETCAETIARVEVGKMGGYDFEPMMTIEKNDHKTQLAALQKRLHTGEKPFNCDVCLKTFSQKSSLILHKRMHSGEKMYNCKFCQNSFLDKNRLAIHKLEHAVEKHFNCDVCLKSFSQKSSFLLHKRVHTGENNYKCEFCLNSFSNKFQLATHKLQHTGEKPFNCDVCLKCYSQKSSLTLHKRVHDGEKNYKCDFCLKSFSDKSYLSMHKTVHNGEKHFKCDVCLKSFSQKSSLILHKRVHTRNIKLTYPNFHCKLYFSDN